MAEGEQHRRIELLDFPPQIIWVGNRLVAELDDVAGVELPGLLPLARHRKPGSDQRPIAGFGGGGLIVHGKKDGAGLGDGARPLLPAQDLFNVRLIALIVGKGQPPDVIVRRLDLLNSQRHLIQIAEDQLVARQVVGGVLAGVKVLLLPLQRLDHVELGGGRIDLDLPPALRRRARSYKRRNQRKEALPRGALGNDHPPALALQIVLIGGIIPQVARGAPIFRLVLGLRRAIGKPGGQDRPAVIGVHHQQIELTHRTSLAGLR